MKKLCAVSFLLLALFLLVGCKAEPEFSVATLPSIDGVTAECVAEREGEEWQISVKVKNTTSEAVTIKVALTAQAPFAADRYLFPGINYNGNDFGDAIRFSANTAVEDEADVSKVFFDTAKFRAFTKGFIGATKGALENIEIASLVKATFSITIELASRFLDDYITGDKYFRCTYPKHNLVRTRCQLQLARDIERKWSELEWIIKDVAEKIEK